MVSLPDGGSQPSEGFLNELLLLFRYLPRSAADLLEGYPASSVLCREVSQWDSHLAPSC